MHIKKMIVSLGTALLLCLNFSVVSYAETVILFTNDNFSLADEIADNCTSDLEIVNRTAQNTSIADGLDAVKINRVGDKFWNALNAYSSICLIAYI